MTKQFSEERKAAYYIGTGLMVIGFILFASTFVTFIMHFGDFSNFESNVKSGMFRAVAGMAFLIVGKIIRGIGARGLAGSGIVLDPDKARQELEPYTRMAGGMLKDALDEADVHPKEHQKQVIMIKCLSCGKLNAEEAKFCQECGKKI